MENMWIYPEKFHWIFMGFNFIVEAAIRMSSINDTWSDRIRAGKSVACKMILNFSKVKSFVRDSRKSHDVSTHWSMQAGFFVICGTL